jgi:hypothetical protein
LLTGEREHVALLVRRFRREYWRKLAQVLGTISHAEDVISPTARSAPDCSALDLEIELKT